MFHSIYTTQTGLSPAPRRPDPYRGTRRHRRNGGFTLIEAALTTVIIGTGVLAILSAQQAYHIKNDWSQASGTAMLLANEVREMTLPLPDHDPITGSAFLGPEANEYTEIEPGVFSPDVSKFDDIDDFAGEVDPATGEGAGLSIYPPVNALGEEIPNMERWRQEVSVENVLVDNIASNFAQPLGTTDMVRVTVRVMYQRPKSNEWNEATRLVWIVSD